MAGWVRFCVLAAISAVCAFGADSVELAGSVIDASTRLPVPGADVVLRFTGSSVDIKATTSDKSGGFRFTITQPGTYSVDATADGYVRADRVASPRIYGAISTLAGDLPRPSIKIDESDFVDGGPVTERSVSVTIDRSGKISGELKDGVSRQPLTGFTVKALRVSWYRGKRVFASQGYRVDGRERVVPSGCAGRRVSA